MRASANEPRAPQVGGRHADDDETGGDVDRNDGMGEPIRKRRIEDDLQPIFWKKAAVDDLVAGGGLHPAVGGEDPEGRSKRPERDHQRREEVRPGRHKLAPEQQHAEEGRLEEEGGQPLIGEQRRNDVGDGVGEPAPVGAELERHDDPRDDPHAERHGENLDPESRDAKIDLTAGEEVKALHDGDEGREANRERGQQEMEGDDPGELDSGEDDGIQAHCAPLSPSQRSRPQRPGRKTGDTITDAQIFMAPGGRCGIA